MVPRSTPYTDGQQSPSEAVVRTVADTKEVSPTELSRPLYEAVDPDALDRLVGPPTNGSESSDVSVAFDYCGFRVHVDDSSITLSSDRENAADS